MVYRNRYTRKKAANSNFTLLDNLPGEIRNHIFELCIHDAFTSAKSKKAVIQSTSNTSSNSQRPHFIITVLPQWSGPGSLRMTGVAPLSLLFLNKKFYNEVSSLVYSRIDEVSIGGYLLQYQQEDPSVRWSKAYDLLEKVPLLFMFTTKIKVTLPRVQPGLFRLPWTPIGVRQLLALTPSNGWAMIPGLVKFLKRFEVFTCLEIVIVVDASQVPNFEPILPLWNIYGKQMSVTFVRPEPSSARQGWDDSWLGRWDTTWNQCLLKKRETELSGSTPDTTLELLKSLED